MKIRKVGSWLLLGLLASVTLPATLGWSEETTAAEAMAENPEETRPQAIYIPLDPAFVVNYGGAGRLHYLKAAVTVRVAGAEDAAAIRYHMPYIRNQLIMLFGQQTHDSLQTLEGKEQLRQAMFDAIHRVVSEEEGTLNLVGVYFNQLILQN